jgi:hypothetical protein
MDTDGQWSRIEVYDETESERVPGHRSPVSLLCCESCVAKRRRRSALPGPEAATVTPSLTSSDRPSGALISRVYWWYRKELG